jgi:hypothetical protein
MELKRQKIYKKVFDLACRNLLDADLRGQLEKGSLSYNVEGDTISVEIPFFDEVITLQVPVFTFRSSKAVSVNLVTKIILLHYLLKASGESLKPVEERISYDDIPGCGNYLPVFERRALKPLQTAFAHDRYLFLEAGISLGGKEEGFGDAAFTVYALPMVPITIILWEGDEEFPPSVRMLFDPSIPGYLPLEDVVVVAKLAATRVIKAARLALSEDMGD